LGDDATFDVTAGLFTFGGDGVELVDEDDRGSVLFGVLEDLPEFSSLSP